MLSSIQVLQLYLVSLGHRLEGPCVQQCSQGGVVIFHHIQAMSLHQTVSCSEPDCTCYIALPLYAPTILAASAAAAAAGSIAEAVCSAAAAAGASAAGAAAAALSSGAAGIAAA
jgi:hypothetical protein